MKRFLPLLILILCSACSSNYASAQDQLPTSVVPSAEKVSRTPLQPVQPSPTPSLTPTRYPTSTTLPTRTTVPSLTPLPSPTPIPEEFYITGIFGHRQTYSISCESSSAADWATFFGVETYEANIQFALPTSDNPDTGFVGNVHDPWGQIPPYSYGVHAEPIAEVLYNDFDLPAQAEKDFTLEELKAELAAGQPVIAWVIGNMVAGEAVEYKDKNGKISVVAPYEHTVIITGYGPGIIRYLNNGRFYEVPEDIFLRSWKVLGNMVVFYNDKLSKAKTN